MNTNAALYGDAIGEMFQIKQEQKQTEAFSCTYPIVSYKTTWKKKKDLIHERNKNLQNV